MKRVRKLWKNLMSQKGYARFLIGDMRITLLQDAEAGEVMISARL